MSTLGRTLSRQLQLTVPYTMTIRTSGSWWSTSFRMSSGGQPPQRSTRLSKIAAEGSASRPCAIRNTAQIVDDGVKHARFEPTVALLAHRIPGGQVMRHHPPRGPRADDPAQVIEDLPQAMRARGASSVMRVRYGATKARSSSRTSPE
jgi:hypothetical protein